MKWLIALLAAATGILHILVGFNVISGGTGGTNWLLIANGAGFLVLIALFLTTSGSTRRTIRWILLAYTLITLIGYFVLGGGFDNTVALIIKAIELLLAILLLLDRGSDEVAVPAAAKSAAVAAPAAATRSYSAGQASIDDIAAAGDKRFAQVTAAGVTALDKLDEGADEAFDRVTGTGETAIDELGDAGEAEFNRVAGLGESVVDAVSDAGEAVADVVSDAGETVADVASKAGEAVVDAGTAAVAATGAAVAGVIDFFRGSDGVELTPEEQKAKMTDYLKSFGPSSEFNKEIEYIEGIGEAYGAKLRAVGVNKVIDLLVNGATRTGRKHLSDQSGVAQSLILTWVNHVDLFRIKGVAQEYADLLEQSGVDTVVELAQRNPANLHKRMSDLNEQKKLVRRLPHASDVQSWVEQAKDLPRMIHY